MVYFSGSNVMHLGDVFRTTSYPVIDVYNGGPLKGTIQALDQAIALANSETKIIPGHGQVLRVLCLRRLPFDSELDCLRQ